MRVDVVRASVVWIVVLEVLAAAGTSFASMQVTIPELKKRPAVYYDQPVTLECYFDKESPIWVSALPKADEWIGFFVTGNPEKALSWSGEYYNLLFAPQVLEGALRTLRGGDKITVIGTGFHYQSESLDGAGIRVEQILRGWGPGAKTIGDVSSPGRVAAAPSRGAVDAPTPPQGATKYVAVINGKRYEGLRFGDRYNFEGVEFQVEQAQ